MFGVLIPSWNDSACLQRAVGATRPRRVVRRDGWFRLGGDSTVRSNAPRHGFDS